MANPQLENGHTRIANEILEALMRIYLPSNQWQVLLCIIRKTYGFRKKVDWIANFQIVEYTGLVKSTVSRALRGLEERGLINRNGKNIGFQKDWEQWKVSSIANNTKLNEAEVSNPANSEKLAIRKPLLAIQPTKVSSPRVAQKEKENIQKKLIYGEFKNVLLAEEEYQWLKEKLGDKTDEYIEKLSVYLESTGKDKYKSHYATILNWQRRDKESGKIKHSRAIPKIYTPTGAYND